MLFRSVERLTSYFLKRRSGWLREQPVDAQGRFAGRASIQAAFEEWLDHQAERERQWYRRTLRGHFGLDICGPHPPAMASSSDVPGPTRCW